MEPRPLLATVTINPGQVVRAVNTDLLGVNLVEWDSNLNTAQTAQMVQAAGLTMFRFPGGSASDDFHFNVPPTYNGQGTDASIASFIGSVNGVGVATLDYGSGSPQEAAAFLAYLNAAVGNTTAIGNGGEWVDSTNTYSQVNWQTAGYWAGLRASAPLAHDDGLNFLRINHPASFNIHYWEVGNEVYGGWETDRHGQGADPGSPHDPTTYVTFAKQFQTYAASISPGISIGIDAGGPTSDNNWVGNVLTQSVSQGVTVGFISDHNYVQAPGAENDQALLLDTVSDPNNQDPNSPDDWALRANGYESLLTKDLGPAAAAKVELLATEFNSVYSNPGKQTTSLVNGLFVADSLGSLLETPYNGADVWDLRNDYDNSNNNASSLYGWRQAGDYGILGSPNGSAPASGTYVPYPTYFAEQLASKIVQPGGQVVQAVSNDPNLATYAVLESNGQVDLLVINKGATASLTGQFQFTGFTPAARAQSWQYGEAQDIAQSQSTDGSSGLASTTPTLTGAGSTWSSAFPPYSMTVLAFTASSGPTIVTAAGATPNPVVGTTTTLSVGATDPGGASTLTYTWATSGTPPAPVAFSVNGTNAAQTAVATFSAVGTYNFQVTATDPGGLTATSTVAVTVSSLGGPPTLADPGFEAVPVGDGFAYDPTGSAWTFTGLAGVSGNNSAFTSSNPAAPRGSQVAFLQTANSKVIQSVAGWAAGSYTVAFDAALRANYGTQDFEVLVDNNVVGTFKPTSTAYQAFTTPTFTVTAGAHTVEFLGLDTSGGDATDFLDAVAIQSAPVGPSVADSGFEAVPVGSGAFAYAPTGSAWTFTGGSGVSGNSSPFTGGNPPAPQGFQVAFLQGSGSAIIQSIPGWTAGPYALSFDAAARGNFGGIQDFSVLVDNAVVGTFRPTSTSYQPFTTPTFTVTAGAHSVEFLAVNSAGGDDTAFLDAVTIQATPAVPTIGDSGFESALVGSGYYAYEPTSSAWSFTGLAGVSGNNSGFTSGNPVAPQGSRVAFLQKTGAISQSVPGWSAGNDTISLDAALRGNGGGIEDFEVLVDGGVVGTFRPTSTSYQIFTTSTFIITAGTHVIKLLGINTAGGDDTDFIDAVSITSI